MIRTAIPGLLVLLMACSSAPAPTPGPPPLPDFVRLPTDTDRSRPWLFVVMPYQNGDIVMTIRQTTVGGTEVVMDMPGMGRHVVPVPPEKLDGLWGNMDKAMRQLEEVSAQVPPGCRKLMRIAIFDGAQVREGQACLDGTSTPKMPFTPPTYRPPHDDLEERDRGYDSPSRVPEVPDVPHR